MKRFSFLLFVLLISTFCFSQTKQVSNSKFGGGCFSFFSGYGKPVSDFGSSDPKNRNAGWAKPAINFEASYTRRFSKYIGFSLMARSISNPFNTRDYESYLRAYNPDFTINVTSQSWKLKTAMIGAYFSFPLAKTKKITLDIKCMSGVAFATSMDIVVVYKYNPGTYQGRQELLPSSAKAFAYLLGAGIKYDVSEIIAITLQADFTSTIPEFEDKEVYSGTIRPYYTFNPFKQSMQLLNFNLGLGFKFD